MISYAQNCEDVLLNRVFQGVSTGFYIDVGAGHPEIDSVTKHFYDSGWRGINIEPRPAMHTLLCEHRQRDVNLRTGISNSKSPASFFEVRCDRGSTEPGDSGGLSTFDRDLAAVHRQRGDDVQESLVEVTTLADVCDHFAPGDIYFLKIDVEGYEAQVLRGMDLRQWRPRVVIVEAIDPVSRSRTSAGWEDLILAGGYQQAFFDGINLFFVRNEDRCALLPGFDAPVNLLDDYVTHRFVRTTAERDLLSRDNDRLKRQLAVTCQSASVLKRDLTSINQNLTTLRDELATREQELDRLKRRTGPTSLVIGLKLARQIHRLTHH